MITENKRITITGGTAPYSFVTFTTLPCTIITPSSGVSTDGIIDLNIAYEDISCLESTELSIYIVDFNGCKIESEMPVVNNCAEFEVAPISFEAPYTFTSMVSHPGCGVSNIEWIYDDVSFSVDSITDTNQTSKLVLKLNPGTTSIPTNSPVTARVTSCFGCEGENTYYFSICQPETRNMTLELICSGNFYTSPVVFPPRPRNCPNAVIDWNTLQFDLPRGFQVERIDPITGLTYVNGGFRIIAELEAVRQSSYSIAYTVKTTEGVTSTRSAVYLSIAPCLGEYDLFIFDQTFVIPCDAESGDTFTIPLANRLFIGSEVTVDWETFTVLPTPEYISPNIQLQQDFVGNQYIVYTIPDLPPAQDADVFKWYVCATNGYCAVAGTYTIQLSCNPAPVAVDDTTCAVCGQPVTINVLSNDTSVESPLQPESLVITTTPTLGAVVNNGDGTITYTPNQNAAGADSLKYTVKNLAGRTSNEGTVTINVVCAGGDVAVKLCND
jgi:hypothetical protein